MPQDVNAGTQNKFVSANDVVNPNQSDASETSADSMTGGAASYSAVPGQVGSRPGPETGHGFLSKSERPYHGAWQGRFEDRPDDQADSYIRKQATNDEQSTVAKRNQRYDQHGNVGWAGNYAVNWEAER